MTELWTFSLCKRTIKICKPNVKLPRGHNDCLEILAAGTGLTPLQFYNDVNPIQYLQDNDIYVNILSQNEYQNCLEKINYEKENGKKITDWKPLPGKCKNVDITNLSIVDTAIETEPEMNDTGDLTEVITLLKDIQGKMAILLARNCPF